MSEQERNALEAENFEVMELDDDDVEDVTGGNLNRSCNESGCMVTCGDNEIGTN